MREGEREFGVLVDPADPEDVAHGLLRVVGSPESWQRFHLAGQQRVLSRYTWERTAGGYLRVIEEMLQGPAYSGGLPVPEYFANPAPETDIPVPALGRLYFG
jgi:sucrose-phosphate synthase